MKPTVIVRIDADGNQQYLSTSTVDVFVVDDRTPHDRVFRMTAGSLADQAAIDEIIGDDAVGHAGDQRHEALTRRVERAAAGDRHLTPVDPTRH